jgi:hypothetical protein
MKNYGDYRVDKPGTKMLSWGSGGLAMLSDLAKQFDKQLRQDAERCRTMKLPTVSFDGMLRHVEAAWRRRSVHSGNHAARLAGARRFHKALGTKSGRPRGNAVERRGPRP